MPLQDSLEDGALLDLPASFATNVRLRHFSRSLPMLLLQGRESVMRHFRALLRDFDITDQQWRVLRTLTDVGEIEVSDLARATYLLGPSLSRILRDLERRQLITRRTDQADQRRSVLRVSASGLALIERVTPRSEQIYSQITARFGEQNLEALQNLLQQLEAVMNKDAVSISHDVADEF